MLPNPNLKLLIRSLCQQSYHFRVLPKMYEISSDPSVMMAMANYVRARGRRRTPTLPIKSEAGRGRGMTVRREPFDLYQCRYTRKAVTSYSGLCKYKIEQQHVFVASAINSSGHKCTLDLRVDAFFARRLAFPPAKSN